jgi:hypothetical protein
MGSSVFVSVDGPSKVGSTFFTGYVEKETGFQQTGARTKFEAIDGMLSGLDDTGPRERLEVARATLFRHVGRLSAGNFFRALALAQAISELRGQPVREIRPDSPEDRSTLLEFMAIEGIGKVLQTDPHIVARVSKTAKLPGAIDLCENAFCDAVSQAYHRDGGDNLVIADARNPLDIYGRRDLMGTGPHQVAPQSIVPVYLDAPAEVAAGWLGGDYDARVTQIVQRRAEDATRDQYPVVVPGNLTTDIRAWADQFYPPGYELAAKTYHLRNGAGVTEGNIQWLAGVTAAVAWDLHAMLNRQAAPSL